MRIAILWDARRKLGSVLGFNRLIHSVPQSPPLAGSIDHGIQSVQPILPEFSSPSFSFGGSMELMAVPKRKVRYLHNFSFILDFLFLLDTIDICWILLMNVLRRNYVINFSTLHFITFVMVLFFM
jgi:hypothetical protein